jgi:hypothetical protein
MLHIIVGGAANVCVGATNVCVGAANVCVGAANVCVVTTACSVKRVDFLYLDILNFVRG